VPISNETAEGRPVAAIRPEGGGSCQFETAPVHAQPLAAAGPCSAALVSRERGKSFANFATLIADLKRSRWFLRGGWPELARVERGRGWDRSIPNPGKMNRAHRVGPAERRSFGSIAVECCQAHADAPAVNAVISKRFAKRQQMQWTKRGAHLLLQMRT
jgi:hypothetical protein